MVEITQRTLLLLIEQKLAVYACICSRAGPPRCALLFFFSAFGGQRLEARRKDRPRRLPGIEGRTDASRNGILPPICLFSAFCTMFKVAAAAAFLEEDDF